MRAAQRYHRRALYQVPETRPHHEPYSKNHDDAGAAARGLAIAGARHQFGRVLMFRQRPTCKAAERYEQRAIMGCAADVDETESCPCHRPQPVPHAHNAGPTGSSARFTIGCSDAHAFVSRTSLTFVPVALRFERLRQQAQLSATPSRALQDDNIIDAFRPQGGRSARRGACCRLRRARTVKRQPFCHSGPLRAGQHDVRRTARCWKEVEELCEWKTCENNG